MSRKQPCADHGGGRVGTTQQQRVTVQWCYRVESCFADVVIAHQKTQFRRRAQCWACGRILVADGHGEGVGTVHYPGVAQRRNGIDWQAGPHVELLHQARAVLRQGNFPSVERRLHHAVPRRLFDQRHAQAHGFECLGQRQAGRPGTDDQDIEMAGAISVCGVFVLHGTAA